VQPGRFVDLYVSETREHLQLLTRSILSLERGDTEAVEEAFRAAHTIKGLAAAMGHGAASDAAHALEDELDEVRSGAPVSGELADRLLAAVDVLETAIGTALAGDRQVASDAQVAVARTEASPADMPPGPDEAPAGTARALVVRISNDAALPEARAEVIRRAASGCDGVLGVRPVAGRPFGNVLYVLLAEAADVAGVRSAVESAGDVASVELVEGVPDGAARGVAVPQTRPQVRPASVRVDRARLDDMAEAIAELSVLHARAAQSQDRLTSHRAAAVLASLQRMILELRMVPVSTALDRVARLVRDASRKVGKEVEFDTAGGEIELDQSVLDALVDPLVHLLRNAIDHGIEAPEERAAAGKSRIGRITVATTRDTNGIRMLVSDDGRGIDVDAVAERGRELGMLGSAPAAESDVLRLLFQPGFSTTRSVTDLSGRGVGLDVVASRVRGLGGAIEVGTRPGQGTTFTLRVPVTLALSHSLRVRLGSEEYALPITHIREVVPLSGDAPARGGTIMIRDEPLPLIDLGRVLGCGAGLPTAAIIAELGERRVALAVEKVMGHEQVVVKPFDPPVGALPVFSGATILADGRPALLIDPLSVL
jgi:two-component system chemotaxis sensor kinase CheA